MKNRYLILRGLFDRPLNFNQLIDETDLTSTLILNSLKSLFRSNAIKSITDHPQNDIPKSRKMKFYVITENGRNKLAYYEYKHQFYKEFPSRYDDSLNQPYYSEIQKIIEENNHFTFKKNS